MPFNSNALITVEEYKILAVIDDDDTQTDQNIEQFINYASDLIERETGRKFITPLSDFDEYFDGDNEDTFDTKYWPLTEVITVIKFLSDNDWDEEFGSTNISTDLIEGTIQFTDGNVFFETGITNYWKISYKYGYTIGNVPSDLKMACANIANLRRTQWKNKTVGVSSRSISDMSTSYDGNIEQWVKDVIEGYKRRH